MEWHQRFAKRASEVREKASFLLHIIQTGNSLGVIERWSLSSATKCHILFVDIKYICSLRKRKEGEMFQNERISCFTNSLVAFFSIIFYRQILYQILWRIKRGTF